jgi:hypothetical protein
MVRDGGAQQVGNGGRNPNQEQRNHDPQFTGRIASSLFHGLPALRAVTSIIGRGFYSLTWRLAIRLSRFRSKGF